MGSRWLATCVLGSFALYSSAQEVQFKGPSAGLIFDPPSRSLRQVLGVPGAARLGPPVVPDLDWASVAPNGRLALMFVQGEFQLFFLANGHEATSRSAGEVAKSLPTLCSWADDSQSLLLYWSETRSLQRLRIENERAVTDGPAVLSGAEGDLTALASDNTGAVVVAAFAGTGLYRVAPAGETHPILSIADGSGFALDSNGQSLWVVDTASAGLISVKNLVGSKPEVHTELIDVERLSDIVAVRWSSDRSLLYLLNRSASRLYAFHRETSAFVDGIELDSVATRLQPLGRSSLLLLGSRTKLDDPLYLLDEKAGSSIFFVPPGEER